MSLSLSLSVFQKSSMLEREKDLENIVEAVIDARAASGIYDAESDVTQYGLLNSQTSLRPCQPDDEVSFQYSDVASCPQYVIGNEV